MILLRAPIRQRSTFSERVNAVGLSLHLSPRLSLFGCFCDQKSIWSKLKTAKAIGECDVCPGGNR